MAVANAVRDEIAKEGAHGIAGPPDAGTQRVFIASIILGRDEHKSRVVGRLKKTEKETSRGEACKVLGRDGEEDAGAPTKDIAG